MLTHIQLLLRSDEGLEMIEYALIISLIAMITLVGYTSIGETIKPQADEVEAAMNP